MNLSKQIKAFRVRDGLSQEALAERIYVSRQTISNWETERSYPDVQSLILLSVLFDVSIDDLVKGDIGMMKKEIDAHKMNRWAWVMLAFGSLGIFLLIPLFELWGILGLLFSGLLIIIALTASIVIEFYKKKHNVKTYSEIVAFLEGKPADANKVSREKSHKRRTLIFKVLGGVVSGLIITLAGGLLYRIIAG